MDEALAIAEIARYKAERDSVQAELEEKNEIIRADGPRMANAEHRLDQAYDAISAMLWLQYQHWPLTKGEKASLLPPIMHKTFTRVEEWKEKQTEGVKY